MDDPVAALERLYRDAGPAVLAYLRQRTCEPQAAEDLLHETFVQAARDPGRLAQAVSARAWLFGIARHVAATAARRVRPTAPLPAEVPSRTPAEDPRLEDVRRAIGELPDAFREALELRLGSDLTYEEIATVLGIPIGTVRSRLHHAVRRLRAAAAQKDGRSAPAGSGG